MRRDKRRVCLIDEYTRAKITKLSTKHDDISAGRFRPFVGAKVIRVFTASRQRKLVNGGFVVYGAVAPTGYSQEADPLPTRIKAAEKRGERIEIGRGERRSRYLKI